MSSEADRGAPSVGDVPTRTPPPAGAHGPATSSSPVPPSRGFEPTSTTGGLHAMRSSQQSSPAVRRSDLGTMRTRFLTPGGTGGSSSTTGHGTGGVGGTAGSLPTSALGESTEDGEQAVIWGTTVNVSRVMSRFSQFLTSYPSADAPLYLRLLEQAADTETYNINLDCQNLFDFDPDLYGQLVRYPQEIIPIFDLIVNEHWQTMTGGADGDVQQRRIQVRTFNLKQIHHMRELNPSDIDTMVAVRGMVIRTSNVIPDLKQAHFRCSVCSATVDVPVEQGRIEEPATCANCNARFAMVMVHNRSLFADKQQVKIQETPDNIPEGETPFSVSCAAFDDLVDVAKPGDRVEITGVYRAVPLRVSATQRKVRSVYKTYLDIIHYKKTEKHRLGRETDEAGGVDAETFDEGDELAVMAEERVARLRELSQRPDIYELLTRSLAPSIWELEDIKKGILCQLFGGVHKQFGESGKFRGDINVLLVGDPGTSKSQLLKFVNKIAPRGIYTSGKGSSAVGLTAYITRDPDTREMVLESGALVLSDRGICCIDEFDKMADTTRAILHEVMEQQTVSIAKAGIVASLNARTSILASANPRESRYNPTLSVVDNIMLPPTLLSRFDLIYLVLDKADPDSDRRLASHLVALYHENAHARVREDVIDMTTLTEYITYARKAVQPRISDDAMTELVEAYKNMRQLSNNPKVITATPRQLESLIRLSEAHARIRFSAVVEPVDVNEAKRLVQVATQRAATDPRTGTIDMDKITTGRSAAERSQLEDLKRAVLAYVRGSASRQLRLRDVTEHLATTSDVQVSHSDVREVLRQLAREEVLTLHRGGERISILAGRR